MSYAEQIINTLLHEQIHAKFVESLYRELSAEYVIQLIYK